MRNIGGALQRNVQSGTDIWVPTHHQVAHTQPKVGLLDTPTHFLYDCKKTYAKNSTYAYFSRTNEFLIWKLQPRKLREKEEKREKKGKKRGKEEKKRKIFPLVALDKKKKEKKR